MPDSPSTTTSRQSDAVAATIAIRLASPEVAHALAISLNVRVLPKPRPARSSHIAQSPGGGSWFGRATVSQPYSSASASWLAKLVINDPRLITAIATRRLDCPLDAGRLRS